MNEADNVNPEEIDGDNDPLAAKTAALIEADILIILSQLENGIQCRFPNKFGLICENGIIKEINTSLITEKFISEIDNGKTSRKDSKGISPKMLAGRDACLGGVKKVVIANGLEDDILKKILLENQDVGTIIVP